MDCTDVLFVCDRSCCDVLYSMWQANEDHWSADIENLRDQIWSLDDRPTSVPQKQ